MDSRSNTLQDKVPAFEVRSSQSYHPLETPFTKTKRFVTAIIFLVICKYNFYRDWFQFVPLTLRSSLRILKQVSTNNLSFLLGTSNKKVWKDYTPTGGTASLLSTITTYSWLVSSLCCYRLCYTYYDFDESIGARLSIAAHLLQHHGWKQALAHPHCLLTSKVCRA